MADSAQHSVSVSAVIIGGAEQILLIKRRDNGRWEPPGGVLERDEDIRAGLHREVFEETGARVDVEALTGVYKNLPRGIVALVFRCRLLTDPSPVTAEATAVQWHPLAAVEHLMPQAYAIRVHDAVASVTPAVRAHDGTVVLDALPNLALWDQGPA